VRHVCGAPVIVGTEGNDKPGTSIDTDGGNAPPDTAPPANAPSFYVYKDGNVLENRFSPTGLMGDIGDLSLDENSQHPYQGKTAFKITYAPTGKPPNECGYPPPCRWAGVRWQYPPGNFGQMQEGHDLRGYGRLRFFARSDSPVKVKFLVGGIPGAYPDSIVLPIERLVSLTSEWQEVVLDLSHANRRHIIGGFGVTINWPDNGIQSKDQRRYVFYVDEVRFER
jgi:hypothetical protein